MIEQITCICCPKGCTVSLDTQNPAETVKGFACLQGKNYAVEELICPKRTISSTAEIKGAAHPRIPVKTSQSIPKDMIFEVMAEINKISVASPIKCGEVLIKNVLGTGADIVACKDM